MADERDEQSARKRRARARRAGDAGAESERRPSPSSEAAEATPSAEPAAKSSTAPMPAEADLPARLPLLPVAHTTLFPGMFVPFVLPEGALSKTVEQVAAEGGILGIVVAKDPQADALATAPTSAAAALGAEASLPVEPEAVGDFLRFGIAARVVKRINLPDNQVSVLVTGLERFELERVERPTEGAPRAVFGRVRYRPELLERSTEVEALLRSCLAQFKQIARDNPLISEEVRVALVNIDGPGKLADFMASVLLRDRATYQLFLGEFRVRERLQHLMLLLKKEAEVQAVQRKIQEDVNQKVASAQREFLLNEQLKLIQKELGRTGDDRARLREKFLERIASKVIPDEAKRRIDEELEKLDALSEQSAEYSVAVNYLDWLTALPWGVRSPEQTRLWAAKKQLDRDHYGLRDVKERILEFLAVRKRREGGRAAILCLVGPPGTGKTSLGKSIAAALGRKFVRFSVGGMRDEAEIKGHRRTYVGAMPGKILQSLRRVGTQNPVLLIDEVDKIGTAIGTGSDPASALLELLDPEQNREFLDHYVDVPFDCSDIFFVTTANTTDSIPPPLFDRLEVIPLSGYTDLEKRVIAERYLLPKQMEENGVTNGALVLTDQAIRLLMERYARESGLRNLEKQLARLCRKAAYRLEMGKGTPLKIDTAKELEKWLGPAPYPPEPPGKRFPPGVAVGLAWTSYGGEVLTVETSVVPGKGTVTLTGTLGRVMQESATIAMTLLRRYAPALNLPDDYFDKHMFHVHVPAGATPKDGPSAGVTLLVSLFSLVSGQPTSPKVAMTGELTLTGKVLPVGGIKEKFLAARRSGVETVLIPEENVRDVKLLPPELRKPFRIIPVSTVSAALRAVFGSAPRFPAVLPPVHRPSVRSSLH
jgi:ATP-dependent Lon protease